MASHEIKCPHCGESFTIDEAGYADIVQQVRGQEFDRELESRLKLAEDDKAKALELAQQKANGELQQAKASKDAEIAKLQSKLDSSEQERDAAIQQVKNDAERQMDQLQHQLDQEQQARETDAQIAQEKLNHALQQANMEKDAQLKDLQAQLAAFEDRQKLAVSEAVGDVEKERDELRHEVERLKADAESARELAKSNLEAEKAKATAEKDVRIQQLQSRLDNAQTSKRLEIAEQVGKVERERDQLRSELDNAKMRQELELKSQEEKYLTQIRDRDDMIERLRELKAKLSTKMVGETLEQHCQSEFNRVRMGMFPHAYFEKDNDARTGSKGDFIFRDYDEDGVEIISIMFEMKNENETTATKHRNEDFFKELDKDRREKNCEYAVLVSMLESDSELYNTGIVDVSYKYPKMYVIRPQFFIQMITLLRNAALNSLEYRRELEQARAQNIDITRFEEKLNDFKTGFDLNYDRASKRFQKAIDEIEKSIDHLQKIKAELTGADRQLELANKKAQAITVKKLTYKNPTMAAKFNEARAMRDNARAIDGVREAEIEVIENDDE
ncbi:MAG: DUF2130 domain-containing protein [Bifidobacterium animalis]|nr:DUF2130 domain-containing protein [Bifidobacterium animalis]MDY5039941.1 DUF2130 domain-containing protein [Bifidobacterium animalis]